MDAFEQYDATALAAEIAAGRISPREAVEAAVERAERLDPQLNAFVETRFEEALAEADAGLPDGPLKGVPTVIKALGADVAGMRTTRGSRLWADDVRDADSELVRRYRAAGMVVLGMTNTPELGKNASTESALHGPAHNPYRSGFSTGGSSGGSAAAVASGIVPVAHANDGGGSIRIPAAATGLFGLKPSRARTPQAPDPTALGAPSAVGHVVTRTVRDSALVLDLTSASSAGDAIGFGPHDPHGPASFVAAAGRTPGRLRFGLVDSLVNGPDVDPQVVEAVRSAAKVLEGLGHEIVPVTAPWDTGHTAATGGVLMGVALCESVDARLAVLGRELRDDDLEPFTMSMLEYYRGVTAGQYFQALAEVQRIGWQVGAAFDDVDLLLTPTLAIPTPEHGFLDTQRPETLWTGGTLMSGFTSVFNTTGMPAMSLPHGVDSHGIPLGVQVAAPFGREDLLLSVATQFEEAAPWQLLAPLATA